MKPYQYITAEIIVSLALSCLLMPVSLSYAISIVYGTGWNLPGLILAVILCIFPVAFAGNLLFRLCQNVYYMRNPSKLILKDEKECETTSAIKDLVASLSGRLKLNKPKVVTIEGPPKIFTFSTPKGTHTIVMSKNTPSILDQDELETIFLHELYHVKSRQVMDRTFLLSTKKIWPPKTVLALIVLLSLIFLSNYYGTPKIAVTAEQAPFVRLLFSGMLAVLIGGGIIFFAALLILVVNSLRDYMRGGGAASGAYNYHDELLADSYSAFMTMKPEKTLSAILKMSGLLGAETDKTDGDFTDRQFALNKSKIPLSHVLEGATIQIKDVKNVMIEYDPAKFGSYDKIGKRLILLRYIKELQQGKIKLRMLETGNSKVSWLLPRPVFECVKSSNSRYGYFLEYSTKNAKSFSLTECAANLSVEPFECFLFLWAAVDSRIMDSNLD